MGQLGSGQDKLFYSFNLDNHVSREHLLRGVDHFLDLRDLRQHLAPFYGPMAPVADHTRYLQEWLGDSTFYRIERDRLADNPDQRIAVDLESFANTKLSLTFDLLSTLETLVWFSIFLWSTAGALSVMIGGTPVQIPGYMLWAAVVYAIAGSLLTNKVGHPLVSINYQLQRVEADFRFGLIRLLLPASSGDCYRQALPSCT